MDIIFYKTISEKNRVDKLLTEPFTLSGSLKAGSNLLSPSILVEANEDIAKYNYVYIEDFNRYYYIDTITNVKANLWNISLYVDVLFTYRNEIKNLPAIIEKQEGTKYTSENYNDGSFRVKEENFTEIIEFSNGFNSNGEFILLTAGAISGGE